MTEKWKRRLTDKLPKLTRRETMIIILLSLLTIVIVFSNISFTTKWFSCSSEGSIKIGKKK